MTDTQQPPAEKHASEIAFEGTTAVMTIKRGERNMLDVELTEWIVAKLRELDARDDVKAIIITGAGEAFCGGADGPFLRANGVAEPFANAMVDLFTYMPQMSTPTVAALNGDALAGGFGLVALADIVVAADSARVGTIEASIGAWPMLAQIPAARRIPQKPLVKNLLTGVPWQGDEAIAAGAVDVVVPADQVAQTAREWAEKVKVAGASLEVGLPAYYASVSSGYAEALAEGSKAFIIQFTA